jgi:hypothetical protein
MPERRINMYYDTQVIYRTEDNTKTFTLNGFTYYRTDKTRKPKKQDESGKLISITEEEFQNQQGKYNLIFDKNINI